MALIYADLETELLRDYRINRRRSLATLEQVRLPHLRAALHGLPAASITPLRIRRYVDSRLAQGAAPASVNRELAALRRMFTLAVQLRVIERAPHIAMLAEPAAREGFVDAAQFARLLAALPPRLRDPVAFCYYSSWRIGEVRALTWENVTWTTAERRTDMAIGFSDATFTSVRDGAAVVQSLILPAANSKNGKPRVLPLRGELAAIILRCHSERSGESRIFDLTNLRRAWTAATAAAGFPSLLIHDLRRSAIRNFIRAGVPESLVMRLSGHRTRKVFERYNIVTTADLESAIARVA